MAEAELIEHRRIVQGNTPVVSCNQEAGSFSQLWGRNCWIADGVLGLIQTHAEYIEDRGDADAATQIVKYCKDLREKNRLGNFPDVIES